MPWLSLLLLASFVLVLVSPLLKAQRQHQAAVLDTLTPPGRRLLIRQGLAFCLSLCALCSLLSRLHLTLKTISVVCRRFPGDTGLADDLTRSCNNTISGR